MPATVASVAPSAFGSRPWGAPTCIPLPGALWSRAKGCHHASARSPLRNNNFSKRRSRVMKTTASLSLLAAFFAGSALAAEPVASLDGIEGTVLVNQGEKFITAEPGMSLASGDRILIMVGGKASLTFTDGCSLPLSAGSMTTVPAASTCAGAVAQAEHVGPMFAQAIGGQNEPWYTQMPPVFWVSAAVAIGVGTYLIVEDDDKDQPISQ